MVRFLVPAISAACLLAQDPGDAFRKPPPDVDDALRARITKFYQLQVEGKPRQAEQYVAEDTKDLYYSSNKPKYLSFEISRINYSDDYTRAKATIVVETIVPIMGFAEKPLKVPIPSQWKLVDGQWYWYVDPESVNMTPFGRMTPGPNVPGARPVAPGRGPDVQTLWSSVKADKPAIHLRPGATSDTVTISNQLPGVVRLKLASQPVPGLDVALDRTQLKGGEKAAVTFRWTGAGAPPSATALIEVEPINSVIPIKVN